MAENMFELFFGKREDPKNPAAEETEKKVGNEDIEVAISDLRKQYSEKMQEQYEKAAEKLRTERDDALRENWVLQQRAKAALPEQLAAMGINGGALETNLAGIDAQYQKDRGEIRSDYSENLGDLTAQHSAKQGEAEKGYNEKWLEYLMSLAKMEKEHQYEF